MGARLFESKWCLFAYCCFKQSDSNWKNHNKINVTSAKLRANLPQAIMGLLRWALARTKVIYFYFFPWQPCWLEVRGAFRKFYAGFQIVNKFRGSQRLDIKYSNISYWFTSISLKIIFICLSWRSPPAVITCQCHNSALFFIVIRLMHGAKVHRFEIHLASVEDEKCLTKFVADIFVDCMCWCRSNN